MKRRYFLFALVILPLLGRAAPVERDVGLGLVYVRVHALPADLPAKPTGRIPPCIVDLRYVDADAESAAAFSDWIKSRSTPRTPVFVLASAETSLPLLKVLAVHERAKGIAVVGIERGSLRPDVAVKASPENERRAYDAFENGTALSTLITDHPNKVRNDEASLSKDRLAEASADAARPSPKDTPPLVDATLQRAVHLHRALVALRKI